MQKAFRHVLIVASILLASLSPAPNASAQMTVIDPTNLAQNLLQATRALELRIGPRAPLTLELNTAGGAKQNGEKVEVNPTVGGGRPSTRRVSVSGVTEAQAKVTLDPVTGKTEIEFKQPGAYRIQWTVNDGVSAPVTREATWVISARPLSIGPVTLVQPCQPNAGGGLGAAALVAPDNPNRSASLLPADACEPPEPKKAEEIYGGIGILNLPMSGDGAVVDVTVTGDGLDPRSAPVLDIKQGGSVNRQGTWNNANGWTFSSILFSGGSSLAEIMGLRHNGAHEDLLISMRPVSPSGPSLSQPLPVRQSPSPRSGYFSAIRRSELLPNFVPFDPEGFSMSSFRLKYVDTAASYYARAAVGGHRIQVDPGRIPQGVFLWLKPSGDGAIQLPSDCEPFAGGCLFSGPVTLGTNFGPNTPWASEIDAAIFTAKGQPTTHEVRVGFPWITTDPLYYRPGDGPNGVSFTISTEGDVTNATTGAYGPVAPGSSIIVRSPGLTEYVDVNGLTQDQARALLRDSTGAGFPIDGRFSNGGFSGPIPKGPRPGPGSIEISRFDTGIPISNVPVDIYGVAPAVSTTPGAGDVPLLQGLVEYSDGTSAALGPDGIDAARAHTIFTEVAGILLASGTADSVVVLAGGKPVRARYVPPGDAVAARVAFSLQGMNLAVGYIPVEVIVDGKYANPAGVVVRSGAVPRVQ